MTVILHCVCGFLLWIAGFTGQAPASASSTPAAPLIQNERVTVWDYSWTKGAREPIGLRDEDCVIVYLAPNPGGVVFQPKGSVAPTPPGPDGVAWRAKVIALHDRPEPPRKNSSGYPDAFPRPGARTVLDNARVTVWDYAFMAASPSPMHFHGKDVVVTYIGAGALESTTPQRQSTTNEYAFGDTRFNLGDRTHTELLTRGNLRIIAVELK